VASIDEERTRPLPLMPASIALISAPCILSSDFW
jgi:hypothetical protein